MVCKGYLLEGNGSPSLRGGFCLFFFFFSFTCLHSSKTIILLSFDCTSKEEMWKCWLTATTALILQVAIFQKLAVNSLHILVYVSEGRRAVGDTAMTVNRQSSLSSLSAHTGHICSLLSEKLRWFKTLELLCFKGFNLQCSNNYFHQESFCFKIPKTGDTLPQDM